MPEIDGTGVQVACTCTEVTCQEGNVLAATNTGASRRTRPGPGSLAPSLAIAIGVLTHQSPHPEAPVYLSRGREAQKVVL